MCNPLFIAMGMTAVAGVAKAQGQRGMGKAQNKIAQRNADAVDQQAVDVGNRGAIAEERHRMQVRQFMGRQRAAMGGNGLSLDTGVGLDLQTDTARMGELDALTIRNNAAREAWGYRVKASQYRIQGKLDQAAGKNAAVGTLLTTMGSMASMYAMGAGGGSLSGTAGVNQSQPYINSSARMV